MKLKKSNNNLIILQTVNPDYRSKLFKYLKRHLDDSFSLYAGEYYFEKSVVSDKELPFKTHIKNNYLFNRNFLFQTGSFWGEVFKNNTMVIELNPRIISNWIILIIRKIIGKKIVLWGHAWPRKGKNSFSDKLRHVMRLLSSEILVYTKTQRDELLTKMKNKKISYAPNSLYYKDEMLTNTQINKINNTIYVGRLTAPKKPMTLVMAFHKAMKGLPKDSNLLIIGSGPEKNRLLKYIESNNLSSRIKVLGHVANYNDLKLYYNSSLVSISPGYLGLSVTQSFSFGVPMIISRNENHSPEIEAVKEGINAEYFKTDDIISLSEKILSFYTNSSSWIVKREKIVAFCKQEYSIEAMGKSFLELI